MLDRDRLEPFTTLYSQQKSRPSRLRSLLRSAELAFIMEAHSGLSAKIVEEEGFSGVWASGLSISAMLGLRDNNEASWTQVLDVLEYMADATTLPILSMATPVMVISTTSDDWYANSASAVLRAFAWKTSCSRRPTPS